MHNQTQTAHKTNVPKIKYTIKIDINVTQMMVASNGWRDEVYRWEGEVKQTWWY